MSSDKMNYGRVFLVVGLTFVIGVMLMFVLQMCAIIPRVMDAYNEIDPNADAETQREQLQERMNEIMDEYLEESETGSATSNVVTVVNSVITALAAFFLTFRTARRWSNSPRQAGHYGLLIGTGVTMSFGMCVVCSMTTMPVKLIALGLLFAGGFFGGQFAAQNLSLGAAQPAAPFGGTPGGLRTPPTVGAGSPPTQTPEVYYTMGIQAALGGRREEAQQHFKRVLQGNPRHVAAWLQLANLADSPEEAWNYLQQARAIDPSDPAVVKAVNVIWPQVAARAQQPPPPPDSDRPAES